MTGEDLRSVAGLKPIAWPKSHLVVEYPNDDGDENDDDNERDLEISSASIAASVTGSALWASFAPKGHDISAQGNALGRREQVISPERA